MLDLIARSWALNNVHGRRAGDEVCTEGRQHEDASFGAFHFLAELGAAVADQPDQQAAANRLMKNQEDIGNAVAMYYGKPAGDKLTALLKEHISIAVDLIKFAKAGDKAAQQQADTKWHRNGEDIADFLSQANPHWPRAALVEMMNTHLSTTTAEVVARLTKKWDDDVRAFDAVYDHILKMSDALADGIVKQFPAKFST